MAKKKQIIDIEVSEIFEDKNEDSESSIERKEKPIK